MTFDGERRVRRRGRPFKYTHFVLCLDDHRAYTPASIVANGLAEGLFAEDGPYADVIRKKGLQVLKRRIRITLGRFANNHCFPDEGDALVTIAGQAPVPGWMGWRWKTAAGLNLEQR